MRGSTARLGALVTGLVLISGLLLIDGAAPPGAATATTATASATTATVAAAAKAPCPRSRLTFSKATGGTTQFGWLLQPGPHTTQQRDWLRYTVTAGKVICDSVTLTNSSKRAVAVRLYAADAYNIADDGGFAFTGFKQKPTGVGTWIKLPITKVTVPAGKAANIPIVVQVPTNVTPGDTAGGVVARETRVRHGASVSGVDVGVRAGVGVRLYATVAGLRHPQMSLTKLTLHLKGGLGSRLFGSGSATVSYQVANSGNVRLTPQSTGKVATRTKTIPLPSHEFPELLPGSPPIVIEEQVHGLRWGSLIGRVHVRVTVTADGAEPVTLETSAWRFPWLSLVGSAVLLGLAAAVWVLVRRRRRAVEDQEPAAKVPEPVGS